MACVADHLVAAPFAVLGSIGVITEQPNVYERLKREGVSFSTVTAGKFKRTLTPTKKIEQADVLKLKEDIAQVPPPAARRPSTAPTATPTATPTTTPTTTPATTPATTPTTTPHHRNAGADPRPLQRVCAVKPTTARH